MFAGEVRVVLVKHTPADSRRKLKHVLEDIQLG